MGIRNGIRALTMGAAMASMMTTGSIAMADDIVETAVNAGSFSTLATALTEAGLVDELQADGPFTVFAPTDEAFAKLGQGTIESLLRPENRGKLISILTYHVAPGELTSAELARERVINTLNGQRLDVAFDDGGIRIDDARVISANVGASNGVIHVIDNVLIPEGKNIVETAQGAGTFKTLLAAAKAAGLVNALTGDGPFTVFAPTDEAFAELGHGTIESLLQPGSRGRLARILQYHVMPGRVYASDVAGGATADTLAGDSVRVAFNGAQLQVNDRSIVATDIEASNGVIHVIDGVLLPPEPRGRKIIGIYNDHPSSSQRDALRLDRREGLRITGLSDDRGAEAAGLRNGDIILSVNGQPATDESLKSAKEAAGAGGSVTITFARTVDVEVSVTDH